MDSPYRFLFSKSIKNDSLNINNNNNNNNNIIVTVSVGFSNGIIVGYSNGILQTYLNLNGNFSLLSTVNIGNEFESITSLCVFKNKGIEFLLCSSMKGKLLLLSLPFLSVISETFISIFKILSINVFDSSDINEKEIVTYEKLDDDNNSNNKINTLALVWGQSSTFILVNTADLSIIYTQNSCFSWTITTIILTKIQNQNQNQSQNKNKNKNSILQFFPDGNSQTFTIKNSNNNIQLEKLKSTPSFENEQKISNVICFQNKFLIILYKTEWCIREIPTDINSYDSNWNIKLKGTTNASFFTSFNSCLKLSLSQDKNSCLIYTPCWEFWIIKLDTLNNIVSNFIKIPYQNSCLSIVNTANFVSQTSKIMVSSLYNKDNTCCYCFIDNNNEECKKISNLHYYSFNHTNKNILFTNTADKYILAINKSIKIVTLQDFLCPRNSSANTIEITLNEPSAFISFISAFPYKNSITNSSSYSKNNFDYFREQGIQKNDQKEIIFVGSSSGKIYTLTNDSTNKWIISNPLTIFASPVIDAIIIPPEAGSRLAGLIAVISKHGEIAFVEFSQISMSLSFFIPGDVSIPVSLSVLNSTGVIKIEYLNGCKICWNTVSGEETLISKRKSSDDKDDNKYDENFLKMHTKHEEHDPFSIKRNFSIINDYFPKNNETTLSSKQGNKETKSKNENEEWINLELYHCKDLRSILGEEQRQDDSNTITLSYLNRYILGFDVYTVISFLHKTLFYDDYNNPSTSISSVSGSSAIFLNTEEHFAKFKLSLDEAIAIFRCLYPKKVFEKLSFSQDLLHLLYGSYKVDKQDMGIPNCITSYFGKYLNILDSNQSEENEWFLFTIDGSYTCRILITCVHLLRMILLATGYKEENRDNKEIIVNCVDKIIKDTGNSTQYKDYKRIEIFEAAKVWLDERIAVQKFNTEVVVPKIIESMTVKEIEEEYEKLEKFISISSKNKNMSVENKNVNKQNIKNKDDYSRKDKFRFMYAVTAIVIISLYVKEDKGFKEECIKKFRGKSGEVVIEFLKDDEWSRRKIGVKLLSIGYEILKNHVDRVQVIEIILGLNISSIVSGENKKDMNEGKKNERNEIRRKTRECLYNICKYDLTLIIEVLVNFMGNYGNTSAEEQMGLFKLLSSFVKRNPIGMKVFIPKIVDGIVNGCLRRDNNKNGVVVMSGSINGSGRFVMKSDNNNDEIISKRETLIPYISKFLNELFKYYNMIAFHREQQRLAVSWAPGVIIVYDLHTGTQINTLETTSHLYDIERLEFSPDGKHLVGLSEINNDEVEIYVWKVGYSFGTFIQNIGHVLTSGNKHSERNSEEGYESKGSTIYPIMVKRYNGPRQSGIYCVWGSNNEVILRCKTVEGTWDRISL